MHVMDSGFDIDKKNIFGIESQHGDDWTAYIDSDTRNLYDGWFREPDHFAHAIVTSRTDVEVFRIIPPSDSSVFQDAQLRGGMSAGVGRR